MADNAQNKSRVDLDQEERERKAREAGLVAPGTGPGQSLNDGGFRQVLAMLMQLLIGGAGLSNMFGNLGRYTSTQFSDLKDGIYGRGDTPLGPKGVKPNIGIGNTVGTTIRSGWEGVLDVIGKHESGGDYNRVYGRGVQRADLTNMTIDEVQAWQKHRIRSGYPSAAVGKYQIVTKTLAGLERQMGLTGKEKFDEAMQDRMAMQLLENRGISKFAAGKMTTGQILNSISQEWAAVENTKGKGTYDGDGLNKAARGSGKQMAMALQNALKEDDVSRTSVARNIDTMVTASKESNSTKSSKTLSASAEMSKAATVPALNDPIAERKIVQMANGKPMFIASYGEDSKINQIANSAPDLRPSPGSGNTPKI